MIEVKANAAYIGEYFYDYDKCEEWIRNNRPSISYEQLDAFLKEEIRLNQIWDKEADRILNFFKPSKS